ncbi:MAG: hypothetical protein HDQ87_01200 [Clostridia bacterium]|nr:hypothetical protein [Clostridia bacterium]
MTQTKSAEERLTEVLNEEALGERALRTILDREGYAQDEIEAAVSDVDWDRQAQLAFDDEASRVPTDPDYLEIMLRARGFTAEQAEDEVNAHIEEGMARETLWAHLSEMDEDLRLESLAAVFPEAELPDLEDLNQAIEGNQVLRARLLIGLTTSMGYSRPHVQQVLSLEQVPANVAREQLRIANPNWKVQARLAAENLALQTLDRDEIQERLRTVGFTPVQVAYALSTAHIDDAEAAAAFAWDYVKHVGNSPEDLRDELKEMGYGPEAVKAALEAVADADWVKAGAEAMKALLMDSDHMAGGPEAFRERHLKAGFTDEQVDAAFAEVDWPQRALDDLSLLQMASIEAEGVPILWSWRAVAQHMKELGYSDEVVAEAEARYRKNAEEGLNVTKVRAVAEFVESPAHLRQILLAGAYTPEEAEELMSRVFVDETEKARQLVSSELLELTLQGIVASPKDVQSMLEEGGFSEDLVENTEEVLGMPWTQLASLYAMSMRADELGEEEIRAEMIEEGFEPEAVNEAVEWAMAADEESASAMMRATSLIASVEIERQALEELEPDDPEDSEEIMEHLTRMRELAGELEALGVDLSVMPGR